MNDHDSTREDGNTTNSDNNGTAENPEVEQNITNTSIGQSEGKQQVTSVANDTSNVDSSLDNGNENNKDDVTSEEDAEEDEGEGITNSTISKDKINATKDTDHDQNLESEKLRNALMQNRDVTTLASNGVGSKDIGEVLEGPKPVEKDNGGINHSLKIDGTLDSLNHVDDDNGDADIEDIGEASDAPKAVENSNGGRNGSEKIDEASDNDGDVDFEENDGESEVMM